MDGDVSDFVLPRRVRRTLRPDFLAVAGDLLPLWDIVTISAAGYFSARCYEMIVPASRLPVDFADNVGPISLIAGLVACLVLSVGRSTFDLDIAPAAGPGRWMRLASWLGLRMGVLIGVLTVIGFFARAYGTVPRLWVIVWAAVAFAVAFAGRLLLSEPLRALQARGMLRERVAIVGSGPAAERLLSHLRSAPSRRVEVVGIFNDAHAMQSTAGGGGDLAQLIALGKEHALDRVILTLPADAEDRLADVVTQLKALDVEVALCPPLIALGGARTRIGQLGAIPVMVLVRRPIRRWGLVLKAIEDRVLGALLLMLFMPVLALIALAVRLDSPGPVIFRQRRHGWNNTEFEVFKFRTMTHGSGTATSGLLQTQRKDRRITRLGYFLRRSSLDELPQLLNVVRGEMSLVGPRPHPVVMRTEEQLGHEIIAEYSHRHRVKPGMTGWAQINGYRGATDTAEQVRKRVECDIYYIDNWSIFFDLRILLFTPIKLLFDRQNAY